MRGHYEIQGRVIERAGGAVIRDEVRLSTCDSNEEAVRTARAFVADGFTTWIFLVEPGSGHMPVYQLLDTLRPVARPVPRSERLHRVGPWATARICDASREAARRAFRDDDLRIADPPHHGWRTVTSPVRSVLATGGGEPLAKRLRTLDPQASPAALFGAELRDLRLRRGLSLASLGRIVHVSGDLLGKIEKAERRPQADLVARLDIALEGDGLLGRRGAELVDDITQPADLPDVTMSPDDAVPALRQVINKVRIDDHAMNEGAEPAALLAHARAAERVHDHVGRSDRPLLRGAIAEAYQLAGWMSFDHGQPKRAEKLLSTSRSWVERAADPALAAFVLGPNLSFVATYGGNAALGVERAYGSIGWARRSGNRRLTAFAMAIGARAHARLGEAQLCFDLLDQAENELSRHTQSDADDAWLSVFDRPALDGHRGSCLLDLGQPDRALDPFAAQDAAATELFVRNRVIWQLDRIDALLRLHEVDQACDELLKTTAIPTAMTPRVRRRLRAVELQLHGIPATGNVSEAIERVRALTAVYA